MLFLFSPFYYHKKEILASKAIQTTILFYLL